MDFKKIDTLKNELDRLRPLPPELMEVVDQKFLIDWTYNSNAIEGNTLTLQETTFFLEHGLTSKGKTLKEYLEAQNHAEAIEWLKEITKHNRPITESFIKELHALLLKGIDFIWVGPKNNKVKKPITPGRYKTQSNHVITLDGKIYKYCEPLKAPEEMEKLIQLINDTNHHPVELAARVHCKFVSIHPFDDGNGRVARLLMNLILMKYGYLPVVIKNDLREDYYRVLMKADTGAITDFIKLLVREEENSLKMVINVSKEYLNGV